MTAPADFAMSEAASTQAEPRRLLLVKLGAIGDVLMALPAAAAMHRAGYAVDWVAGSAVAPLLQLYPWIHVIAAEEAALLRSAAPVRLRSILALWRRLLSRTARQGGYDLCATLYYDRRYRLLTAPVRRRRTLTLSEHDRTLRLLPGRHHTEEYARLLAGIPDGERPHQLPPIPPPVMPASPLPPASGTPRLVLVPAGARNLLRDDALRRWPITSYVALAKELLGRGFEVVLAGGPEDRWASPFFATLVQAAGTGILQDCIGEFSLVETLGLLHAADLVVTHDTGPLHLAGLTGAAIVAIFGPTDPRGRLPQRPNATALWGGEGFACRPCYDGRDYAPCTHNGCMEQVTPELVLQEIDRLLLARQQGRQELPRVVVPEHTALHTVLPQQRKPKGSPQANRLQAGHLGDIRLEVPSVAPPGASPTPPMVTGQKAEGKL